MTGLVNLPLHLQQRLRAELKPGESIAWAGQPIPDRFMKAGFLLWLFFIPWTAFSLFWIAGASGFKWPSFDSGGSFFPLFGIPFVLIGLGGLSAPVWLRRKALSIIYAITNERAITIEGIKSVMVKSYLVNDLGALERTEHQDGSGDLVFRNEYYRDSDGDRQTRKQGFFAIADVRRVEELLEKLIS